ncbi:GroES-like protein [Heliocybe sulcata]|uniref:GroES-like protein n=1 Tax=Heliocybe sulcata TaxID=5364 RepID=A0A5C3MYJ5_9AGAM|nr:GroES-like protein [Heliocybe sulcata]
MSTFTPPKSYRAVAVTSAGKLELIDVDWKDPQPGQVVVKVNACGICRSDEMVVEQSWPSPLPRIPGHEIAGTIVAVHPSEKEWKVGQKAGAGWHGAHCFICDSCKRGDFNTCENEDANGVTVDGGYAEYATLRSECLVRIPDDIDPAEVTSQMCSGVTAYNGMRNMGAKPGDIVAIQGIGTDAALGRGIGHLAIQYARAMGFKTVALSSSESKRELATQLGAHIYLDGSKVNQTEELRKMGGAKLIVATVPNAKVTRELVHGLAVEGTLLLLSVTAEDLAIPSAPMIAKRLSIRGWPSGTPKDMEETVAFTRLANISTHMQKYPLEKVHEAYESMVTGSVKFKAILIP